MENNSAAFNAYSKKLGLYEKNVHEKYLGTIFSKQQKFFKTGANVEEVRKKITNFEKNMAVIENNDFSILKLKCSSDDFDPYVKIGRDGQLFVKRPCLNHLMEVTRFTEPELHNIKLMYSGFAVHH